MRHDTVASPLRIAFGLIAVALCLSGCSRPNQDPKVGGNTTQMTVGPARAHQSIVADASPLPFLFVGEMLVDQTRYFAVQNTGRHTTAWYRPHDKIDEFEIIGLKDSSLQLQSASRTVFLPLNGALITSEEKGPTRPAVQPAAEPPPTITMYFQGKRVEGTPSQLSAEQLKEFNDSKEALLKVRDKVSPDIAPMVDQALESHNVIVASGKEGFKRSDFPPEMAAKLDDATLAKINADLRGHAKDSSAATPPPKN